MRLEEPWLEEPPLCPEMKKVVIVGCTVPMTPSIDGGEDGSMGITNYSPGVSGPVLVVLVYIRCQ